MRAAVLCLVLSLGGSGALADAAGDCDQSEDAELRIEACTQLVQRSDQPPDELARPPQVVLAAVGTLLTTKELQKPLAIPPWPLFAVMFVLDLALGAAALAYGRDAPLPARRARDQDRRAALLGGLIDDVHGAKLQRRRMIGIDRRRLDEFRAVLEELAARYGVNASLEFVPWTDAKDLTQGARIVAAADRVNGGLLIDPFHLSRSSSRIEDIRDGPAKRFAS